MDLIQYLLGIYGRWIKVFSYFLQAARRLSVNVSRRASSVYQFFQYKEELRTAKISATVIVVAFICWGPFFLNLALLTLLGPSSGSEGFNLNAQRLHALMSVTSWSFLLDGSSKARFLLKNQL